MRATLSRIGQVASLLSLAVAPAGAAPMRWETADGGNGHFYEFVNEALTWPEARLASELRTPPPGYSPGHLLTITDDAEDAFAWNTFAATGWLGFTDEAIEGEWRWIDDTPGIWQDPDDFATPIQTSYVNWVGAEPNDSGSGEDYAIFGWFGDSWIDGGGDRRGYYVEYEPAGPACSNGIDDDRDELADFPADPGCADALDESERGEAPGCDDQVDDDADGFADFPADPGCAGASDDSERDPTLVCDDGVDNDGDGLADHPADPDCASPNDDSEEHVPACENGVDDDGDGRADAPLDPGCANSTDDSERDPTLVCDNGVDDDGDGFVDHPADPGCTRPTDDSEDDVPACSNGSDDDGDGAVDYPADPQCTGPTDLSETTAVRWERNGHYYDLSTEALSWTGALAAAAQRVPPAGYQAGHLLSLSDADESAFVVESLGGANGWIGFTDRQVEGEWRWVDATPGIWQDPDVFSSPVQTAYANWVRGEPNDFGGGEDFAEFPVNVLQRWNDSSNVGRRYYVEYEPIPEPACDNANDDDGDGAADFPADPGCSDAEDASERDPALACDDGLDDDGDGLVDYVAAGGGDPACASPTSPREKTECQDGINNDWSTGIDFDGGASLNGGVPLFTPDPQCVGEPWRNSEAVGPDCGLGFEIALVAPLLARLMRRRARG